MARYSPPMPLTLLIACVLGGLRLAGVTHPAFQAAAHLFIGGVAVAWWGSRIPAERRLLLTTFVCLNVVEVACAVRTHLL